MNEVAPEVLKQIRAEVDELTRQGHPTGVLARLLSGVPIPDRGRLIAGAELSATHIDLAGSDLAKRAISPHAQTQPNQEQNMQNDIETPQSKPTTNVVSKHTCPDDECNWSFYASERYAQPRLARHQSAVHQVRHTDGEQ